jgi:hypothetical protein
MLGGIETDKEGRNRSSRWVDPAAASFFCHVSRLLPSIDTDILHDAFLRYELVMPEAVLRLLTTAEGRPAANA